MWAAIPQQFERVVRGVAAALDGEVHLHYERGNHPTVNDPVCVAPASSPEAGLSSATRPASSSRSGQA